MVAVAVTTEQWWWSNTGDGEAWLEVNIDDSQFPTLRIVSVNWLNQGTQQARFSAKDDQGRTNNFTIPANMTEPARNITVPQNRNYTMTMRVLTDPTDGSEYQERVPNFEGWSFTAPRSQATRLEG